MRIAIGGFQHETNTFAPSRASFADFQRDGGWPGLRRGDAILDTMVARNLPIAGFIAQMKGTGHVLLPTAWAATEPSAHVTRDAFERIATMILEGVRDARPDAVYLDLHGAIVTEHLDDGEGELLARVRRLVGPDTPIVASLDLHANVTRQMLACADTLVAYRTYPHVDRADTGARASVGANISVLGSYNDQLSVLKDTLLQANSRIKDVDVAEESSSFAKYHILVQAGTAMLAQANQTPQSVLKLIG
jgi:microcystin degradation protein MlrC